MIGNEYQVTTPIPFTPGSEFAGTVRPRWFRVVRFAVGDSVIRSVMVCAFAGRISVQASTRSPAPDGLILEATAFQVTYSAAYHALVTVGQMRESDWIVVLGASGGVGARVVDIATRRGPG